MINFQKFHNLIELEKNLHISLRSKGILNEKYGKISPKCNENWWFCAEKVGFESDAVAGGKR